MSYIAGQHYFICDVCGFKLHSKVQRKRWDGLLVCPQDYETDHPQKFVKVSPDGKPVNNPRPRGTDVYVQEVFCSPITRTPAADVGSADCFTVDAVAAINYADYGAYSPVWP